MNMDEEIAKQLDKCSRCGLCLDVCPAYKAKHTEGTVLRGKLLQIKGVHDGDLELNQEILYNIDLCLSCERCKKQCPSGIDAVKIFSKIKNQNQNLFERFSNKRFAFNLKMLALRMLYTLKRPFVAKKKKGSLKYEKEILHFKGCVSKNTNSDFCLPFEFINGNFKCCALPFYVKGKFNEYKDLSSFNVSIIDKFDGLVVFDCATCLSAVKSYVFKDPKTLDRLIFYTDLYKEYLKSHKLTSKTALRVTYHHPCHLENAGISQSDVEEILNSIENVTYVPLENTDECCGFGGDFFIRHPRSANTLSLKKGEDIKKTNADIVLTACPTCLWSLKYAINSLKLKKIKALDLSEFLYNLSV